MSDKEAASKETASADAAAKKSPTANMTGNVKLIGIAGLVKGEQYTVEKGQQVIIGRSHDCTICLRDVPAAAKLEGKGENLEEHFRTVSRKHARLAYISPDRVEIEDLSSNGTFIDGERITGTIVISDLVDKPHELKLGTTETLCIDWWKLVPRSQVAMVKVKTKKNGPAPAEGDEAEDDGAKKDEKASGDKGKKS